MTCIVLKSTSFRNRLTATKALLRIESRLMHSMTPEKDIWLCFSKAPSNLVASSKRAEGAVLPISRKRLRPLLDADMSQTQRRPSSSGPTAFVESANAAIPRISGGYFPSSDHSVDSGACLATNSEYQSIISEGFEQSQFATAWALLLIWERIFVPPGDRVMRLPLLIVG